jgi:hypothetical protein
MAFSLTQFENNTQNSLQALDNNFITLSAADTIACGIAGTNTLTFTPNAAGVVPSEPISFYTNYMLFVGVATGSNTGAVTATVGTIGVLNVYKDTPAGPALLSGGEIIANNAISMRYDSTLNSGAGGFHLTSSTGSTGTAISPSSVQVNGGSTVTNMLSGNSPTLTFTATPGWSSQDQTFTLTAPGSLAASALPAPGDFFMVNPPSLPNAGVMFAGMCTAIGSLSSVNSVATVSIRLLNAASASLASSSGVYRWAAQRNVP